MDHGKHANQYSVLRSIKCKYYDLSYARTKYFPHFLQAPKPYLNGIWVVETAGVRWS